MIIKVDSLQLALGIFGNVQPSIFGPVDLWHDRVGQGALPGP